MTYQKSILKPGLKIDVDALDTSVQLTTEASKTPNYGTFTFPWAQPFPKNDTSKSQCVGLSAIWPPLSLSAQIGPNIENKYPTNLKNADISAFDDFLI